MRLTIDLVTQNDSLLTFTYDPTLQSQLDPFLQSSSDSIPHPFITAYTTCQQLLPRIQFIDMAFEFIYRQNGENSCEFVKNFIEKIEKILDKLPHQIDYYQMNLQGESLFIFEQQGQQLTLVINLFLADRFEEEKQFLIQSFLSTLNAKSGLFQVSKEQLSFAGEQFGLEISLQLCPNFCNGEPETLKQLFPEKVQGLRTLLSNTFLPIQSSQVPIHKNKTLYCPPIARVIDQNNNLSDIFEIGQTPTECNSRLNGSFLGIFIESINYLIKDQNDNLPQIFKQLLQNLSIQISLDDQQPENVTSASENILQDFLQQRIEFQSGGGDAGSFLDSPGNIVPIVHFLLAEQSPDHREFIMTVQEIWVRLCFKSLPPSSVLQVQNGYDDCPKIIPDDPILVLQISSIPSCRDDFLGSTGDQYQLLQNDLIDSIDANQSDTYYYCPRRSIFKNYQDPSFNSFQEPSDMSINSELSLHANQQQIQANKVYKIPYHLIHAGEIFECLGFNVQQGLRTTFARNNFLDFFFGSCLSAIILSLQLYFQSIHKFILATDISYSSSKLKLLARDPNFERYKVNSIFYEVVKNSQKVQNIQEYGLDVIQYFISANKLNPDKIVPYLHNNEESNTYGRAFIRKYQFSDHELQLKFNSILDQFEQVYQQSQNCSEQQQNDIFRQVCEDNDIFEIQCKNLSLEQSQQTYQDNQINFFKTFYNINIKPLQDNTYFTQDIDNEIIVAPRYQSQNDNLYVEFMEVGLQYQKMKSLFPQQLTINGISILNKQLNKQGCNLVLDFGFIHIRYRFQLYLYYMQIYPVIISHLREMINNYLTASYYLEHVELPYKENSYYETFLQNKNYRKSSYFLNAFIWTQFNFKKIIITKKLKDKDIVMIAKDQQTNSLILVLRIISYDEIQQCQEQQIFLDIFSQVVQDFMQSSLKTEFDIIFNSKYENVSQTIKFFNENSTDIFNMLVSKLSIDKYMRLVNFGRRSQKYIQPLISSETIIKIPRHYALLKNNYLDSSLIFVQELLQCTFGELGIDQSLKQHIHRFLNTCSVLSVGVGNKSLLYSSSSKTQGEVTQQGRFSICFDITSPMYHVKQFKEIQQSHVNSHDSARQRIQYMNPSIIIQDEIQLFSLIQKQNGIYTFAIDDNFYFGLLRVPQEIFLSEFSSKIFSRQQYAANAVCFISDYDLFLHNIYLIIELEEQSIKLFSATQKKQYVQQELKKIIHQICFDSNFANLRLHALRLALKDISGIFHHNLRCYAHLQSFYNIDFIQQAKAISFITQILEKVQNLPISLAKIVNIKLGSQISLNTLFAPVNLLIIGPGSIESFPEAIQPLIALMEHFLEIKQPIQDDQVELLIPATFISLRKFTFVTDLEAENIQKINYEQNYTTIVDKITDNEFTDSGNSISIAEPSFYGNMLVISTEKKYWQNCMLLDNTFTQLNHFAPYQIDSLITKFIKSLK